MEVLPERIFTIELPNRLGVSRSRVYQLIDKLNIQTSKVGNKAYITSKDFIRLRDAHNFIRKGKSIAEYLLENPQEFEPVIIDEIPETGLSSAGTSDLSSTVLLPVLEMVLGRLEQMPQLPASNPVEDLKSRLETLAICARDQVVLSNQELAMLLGLNYNTTRKQEEFTQYGYTFTRRKEGKKIFWIITHNDPE